MDLELSEEQKLLQRTVREFAEAEVKPLAQGNRRDRPISARLFRKAAELGLTGVAIPESEGGAGMDHVCYAIVIEEISRVCASTGVILSVQNSLVLRSDPPLRHRRAEEEISRALRARRKNRLLRAHRAAGGFERRGARDEGRAQAATATSSTARKPGSPMAAWRTPPSST